MTHYDVLELSPSASTAAVVDAYKRLALLRHPDRPNGSAYAFLELKRARDVLENPELRKRYDAALASRRARPLSEIVDESELELVRVEFGSVDRSETDLGADALSRACRCGDAYEIPVAEVECLRRTHDECVLECGGCSLRIGVRLAPVGGRELGDGVTLA